MSALASHDGFAQMSSRLKEEQTHRMEVVESPKAMMTSKRRDSMRRMADRQARGLNGSPPDPTQEGSSDDRAASRSP